MEQRIDIHGHNSEVGMQTPSAVRSLTPGGLSCPHVQEVLDATPSSTQAMAGTQPGIDVSMLVLSVFWY